MLLRVFTSLMFKLKSSKLNKNKLKTFDCTYAHSSRPQGDDQLERSRKSERKPSGVRM